MRRTATLVAACAAVALSACGDERESDRATAPAGARATAPGGLETAPPANEGESGAPLSAGDRRAIRSVLVAAATNREPCEHLTERYKKDFVLPDTTSSDPDEACRQAEMGQPELKDSDVRIKDVTGSGGKAEVRFTLAGLPQSASLVRTRGAWLIDGFDF